MHHEWGGLIGANILTIVLKKMNMIIFIYEIINVNKVRNSGEI